MTRELPPSAAKLASVVATSTAAHVARIVGADESAIRSWASGKRSPKDVWRTKLADVLSLDPNGWTLDGETQEAPRPPSKPLRIPPRVAQADLSPMGGEERLEQVIRECDELLAIAAEPDSHASVRDRATILSTKASAAVRLSKIRAEDAVSMRKILESAWWKQIISAIYESLAGAPPEFLEKIRARMFELEREHLDSRRRDG